VMGWSMARSAPGCPRSMPCRCATPGFRSLSTWGDHRRRPGALCRPGPGDGGRHGQVGLFLTVAGAVTLAGVVFAPRREAEEEAPRKAGPLRQVRAHQREAGLAHLALAFTSQALTCGTSSGPFPG
jgi:hypothetical protein